MRQAAKNEYLEAMALKAIEATLEPDGRLKTAEPLTISEPTKVIVTMEIDDDGDDNIDLALASEEVWGRDWNRPEEDEARAYLQEETSS